MDRSPVDGTLVVNIGDMLEVWTNGAFKSNMHRVANTGREQYSMPFFVAADYDAVIEPLHEFTSPAERPHYRRMRAGEHLTNRLLRVILLISGNDMKSTLSCSTSCLRTETPLSFPSRPAMCSGKRRRPPTIRYHPMT